MKSDSLFFPIPEDVERVGKAVLDAAFEVHTVLGPGFVERICEDALAHELSLRGLPCERQKAILASYKGLELQGQRIDLLVGGAVIAAIKSVDAIHPVHLAQLLSYLKATKLRLGYVLNFDVAHLKDGIRLVVR